MPAQVVSVESTELFVGTQGAPQQVIRVTVADVPPGTPIGIVAPGIQSPKDLLTTGELVEVPITTSLSVGTEVEVAVSIHGVEHGATYPITIAEPGWTMVMVSHFHYDPVWWNTQAAYTSEWDRLDFDGSPRDGRQEDGFALVHAHLDIAKRDPDYAFVLAELDYLKPFWDCYPERRAEIRALLAEGRLELVGGTYNEPNTNLTAGENTVRNLVLGMGFQREVLGGDPATAWQLDAFGHDPAFPGMVHDAGMTSSSWARGPYHQWGPMLEHWDREKGNADQMQFPAEFEWISPNGRGVTTAYMVYHYSAGWVLDSCGDLESAMAAAYDVFLRVKPVGAAKAVLLPVGGDYTPPNQWVTQIHREWNYRYVWPKFIAGTPKRFFELVSADLAGRKRTTSPQTRDMNPVYTGKDVSYIDTKQAQRAAEHRLMDAEKFATVAAMFGLGAFPHGAVDKAWRQLAYGAHHDAVTGSEGDQVYLDLVTGWRDAHDLAADIERRSLSAITSAVDTTGDGIAVTVFNSQNWTRSDLVRIEIPGSATGLVAIDDQGNSTPVIIEASSETHVVARFLAGGVPGIGYRTFHLVEADAAGWADIDGPQIANTHYRIRADAARGGAIESIIELGTGRELVSASSLANELVVYGEYPDHPVFSEGPWHLVPNGQREYGRESTATVQAQRSAIGERLIITGQIGPAKYTQTVTLWNGVARVDCQSRLDEFSGSDQLVRVRFDCPIEGALPVIEVGNAAIGRGFGLIDVDSAKDPYTLDNPAYNWIALSSTMRVRIGASERAIGIAEVVCPDGSDHGIARDLVVALVGKGVTSSCTSGDGHRYGRLELDSNLPDVRIALGTPEINSFIGEVLAKAPTYAEEFLRQLDATGEARVWVPASKQLIEVWQPSADLTASDELDVLILAGNDLPAVLSGVVQDISDGLIEVDQEIEVAPVSVDNRTVGLLNRGIPGFAITSDGALNLSLVRSCTGWPSGVWIDPPRRTTVDGTAFQLQHWTHELEYALVSGPGDWRRAGLVAHGHDFNHDLVAVVGDLHDGDLPSHQTLLGVDGSFVVTTLKPAGNPITVGSATMSSPTDAVAIRGYEPHGSAGEVRLRLPVDVSAAHSANLLDEPSDPLKVADNTVSLKVTPYDSQTALVSTADNAYPTGRDVLGADREVVQPVYTRYWLHNSGPAAIGFQPVSVHLHPARVAATTTDPIALRLTVANDLTDAERTGEVQIDVPEGWAAAPSSVIYSLDPGSYAEYDVTVTPIADAAGTSAVNATISDGVQQYVDTTLVTVGAEPVGALIEVQPHGPIAIAPGTVGALRCTLSNASSSPARVQVWAISPWGTWDTVTQREYAVDVPALSAVDFDVALTPPADAADSVTWVLLKAAWAGSLSYSSTVELRVGR